MIFLSVALVIYWIFLSAGSQPLPFEQLQILWAFIIIVVILGLGAWLAVYRPPSRRDLVLARLAGVVRRIRDTRTAPGTALRNRFANRLGQACSVAIQATPTMAIWNPDLFFGQHQRLFEALDGGLRRLAWNVRKAQLDNLSGAETALERLVQYLWDHPDEVSAGSVALAKAFETSVGGPAPTLGKTLAKLFIKFSATEVAKAIGYAVAIFLVVSIFLAPFMWLLKVSLETSLLTAIGLTTVVVVLWQTLRKRQLD